jgi:predicted ATPase
MPRKKTLNCGVQKRIVITGGPGFGKSSIIKELEARGYRVFHEVAREIIHEMQVNQRHFDLDYFSAKVQLGRVQQFHQAVEGIHFYDRGLPDIAGFLVKDKVAIPDELVDLCATLTYHKTVFITPPWETIYHKDPERREDFREAVKVHKALEATYASLGYDLVSVPMGSIIQRCDFVLNHPSTH